MEAWKDNQQFFILVGCKQSLQDNKKSNTLCNTLIDPHLIANDDWIIYRFSDHATKYRLKAVKNNYTNPVYRHSYFLQAKVDGPSFCANETLRE